jgi:hypothetical protein
MKGEKERMGRRYVPQVERHFNNLCLLNYEKHCVVSCNIIFMSAISTTPNPHKGRLLV